MERVTLRDISYDKFKRSRAWCKESLSEGSHPEVSASDILNGKLTAVFIFKGTDAMKDAALFRIFWDG